MLDAVETRIIEALQADGRATWSDIAQRVGITPSTAHRRGVSLLERGVIMISVLAALDLFPATARMYEVQLRCRPGTQRKVAYRLAQRHDTRWVAIVTGDYDVDAEIVIPKGDDVARVLVDELQSDPDVVATRTALVLDALHVANDWSRRPSDAQASIDGAPAQHTCESSHLTAADRAILDALRYDGRRTYATLAHSLQMNETTVRRRLTELFARGCAYTITLVQPYMLGYEQEALIRLDVTPNRLQEAMDVLAQQDGVHYVATTLSTTTILCEVIAKSHHELSRFLRDVVATIPGTTRMVAELELVVFKRAFVISPWATPLEQRFGEQAVPGAAAHRSAMSP